MFFECITSLHSHLYTPSLESDGNDGSLSVPRIVMASYFVSNSINHDLTKATFLMSSFLCLELHRFYVSHCGLSKPTKIVIEPEECSAIVIICNRIIEYYVLEPELGHFDHHEGTLFQVLGSFLKNQFDFQRMQLINPHALCD